jgi:hypothetical protein
VYGGAAYSNPYAPTTFGDFWFFSVASNSWTQLQSSGTPGIRAASAMVTIGTNLYLFGGIDNYGNTKNDLWKWSTTTNTWTQITTGGATPTAMENHIAVVSGSTIFVGFGETYSFSSGFGVTVGMWSINVGASAVPSWTFIDPASAPSPRNYVSAVSDGQGRVIIFGSDQPGGTETCGAPFLQNPGNETWVYQSGQWAQSISCFPTLINPVTLPYGIKRHRALLAPAPISGVPIYYAIGGYGWNANSPDCATRQEWNGELLSASLAEILHGVVC